MAAGYVQVAADGPGKKTQTFVNTIGADSVHAEGIVLVDSAGVERTTLPVSQLAATNPGVTTLQNAATANGNGTNLDVQGYASAILVVPSGGGTSTLNFEISNNDTQWQSIVGYQVGVSVGGALAFGSTAGSSSGAFYRFSVAGFKSIRARISAYSGGSITVTGYASVLIGEVAMLQGLIRLTDGTNTPAMKAGSTSAAAGDSSLVVAISPNSNTVQDIPAISGGLSKNHFVSPATDCATSLKAGPGQLYGIAAFNLNAAPRYLKFHNTAGVPTAGSGVTDVFMIPGNTAGAGLVINFDKGILFTTGIGFTCVTGIADNNTTAVGANDIVVNIYYK